MEAIKRQYQEAAAPISIITPGSLKPNPSDRKPFGATANGFCFSGCRLLETFAKPANDGASAADLDFRLPLGLGKGCNLSRSGILPGLPVNDSLFLRYKKAA